MLHLLRFDNENEAKGYKIMIKVAFRKFLGPPIVRQGADISRGLHRRFTDSVGLGGEMENISKHESKHVDIETRLRQATALQAPWRGLKLCSRPADLRSNSTYLFKDLFKSTLHASHCFLFVQLLTMTETY